MLKVQVGKFPGRIETYMLDEGATVTDALRAAEITLEAEQEVKVNGAVATTSRTLNAEDIVLVSQRIKGA